MKCAPGRPSGADILMWFDGPELLAFMGFCLYETTKFKYKNRVMPKEAPYWETTR